MSNYNNNKKNYAHRWQTAREQVINFDSSDIEPQAQQPKVEPRRHGTAAASGFVYISFGSGSSGNCAYVGNENGGILVDAGIADDIVFDTLERNGVTPSMIKGIVLTHDHQDHVRYVYTLVRKNRHIRIYCTPRVMNGLLRRHNISRRVKEYHESIFKEIPFQLAGMTITAFDASHDGSDNMGFDIAMGDKHFVAAADMGIITPRAHYYMSRAHYLVIESNYDLEMLNRGHYPEYLKNRVRGERGHLDNKQTARFLVENYHDGLEYVFLCHLSKDNNTPDKALGTITEALNGMGLSVGDASNEPDQRDRDIQLYALPRYVPSTWFVL